MFIVQVCTASPGRNRVSDGKTHYAWQKSYTVAKVMVYGFCHVMAFPIVPWQNPWMQWNVISMGFAIAHWSMGFAIHNPKRKYPKLFPQTDYCDCTSCFQSAWNILAKLHCSLVYSFFSNISGCQKFDFWTWIFIVAENFKGRQKYENYYKFWTCFFKNFWQLGVRSWAASMTLLQWQKGGGEVDFYHQHHHYPCHHHYIFNQYQY